MSAAVMETTAATPALVHSIAASLQLLLAGIENLLGMKKSSMAAVAELARASTRLQQLQQWLPPGHGLHTQLTKLHKLLPALLQPQTPDVTVRLLAAVYTVQHSASAGEAIDWSASRVAAKPSVLRSIAQLWRWQQAAATDAAWLLQPLLSSLLQQLVSLARRPAPAAVELANLLLRLRALMDFSGSAHAQSAAAELLQVVSLAVLHPWLFTAAQQLLCWRALWCLAQQPHLPSPQEPVCHDLELLQTVQLELTRYRRQLQLFLQQTAARPAAAQLLPSYPIMLLHYRLPWMLMAAEQRGLSWLCQLWHQCLLVHWQHRLPLGKPLLLLWHELVNVLDLSQWSANSVDQISRQHLRLLQLWPLAPVRPVDCVAFHGVREGDDDKEVVPLNGIPERLSRAFVILSQQVESAWFAGVEVYAMHLPPLITELLLLEQGAAAVKLPVLEQFCSLLLALHEKARRITVAENLPASLLWRAHLHLRDLLDEAAAWQELAPDAALMDAMRNWLPTATPLSASPNCAADAAAAMLERLHRFMDALSDSVEQPLRFSAELAGALPESQLPACEEALIIVLRFLVLEQVQAMVLRRQSLKPRATTLVLRLQHTEDGIVVEITETGVETAPDAQTLKRLRHKLPDAVQRLYCSTQPGRGRSFRFVI